MPTCVCASAASAQVLVCGQPGERVSSHAHAASGARSATPWLSHFLCLLHALLFQPRCGSPFPPPSLPPLAPHPQRPTESATQSPVRIRRRSRPPPSFPPTAPQRAAAGRTPPHIRMSPCAAHLRRASTPMRPWLAWTQERPVRPVLPASERAERLQLCTPGSRSRAARGRRASKASRPKGATSPARTAAAVGAAMPRGTPAAAALGEPMAASPEFGGSFPSNRLIPAESEPEKHCNGAGPPA